MARSGPWSARFTRVISRMTDSAKLPALRLNRTLISLLLSRMRSLEREGGAGAGAAALGLLEAVLPLPAGRAGPDPRGEELQDVGAAEQPDQPALLEHRKP